MILDQKDLRLYRLRSSQHKPGVWLRAPEIVPGVREGAHRPKMLLTKAASTQVLQRPILAEEALIGLGREVVDSRRKVARHPGSKMCIFSRQNQHQLDSSQPHRPHGAVWSSVLPRQGLQLALAALAPPLGSLDLSCLARATKTHRLAANAILW